MMEFSFPSLFPFEDIVVVVVVVVVIVMLWVLLATFVHYLDHFKVCSIKFYNEI